MREENFNICGSGYDSPENTSISNQSSQVAAPGRGNWVRRAMVSGLLGAMLLMLAMLVFPVKSSAQMSVIVSFGPPAIPVYMQPPIPGPGYIWTPGYWAWDPYYGYFWVPGTWLPAPFIGAMWTPGYWAWYNDGYMWYPGYWGTAVGFYGGIDYGYGYNGYGYYGGYWRGNRFYYNRAVNHITNVNIVNVYNQRVVENNGPRISYNGGRGGIDARPNSVQLAAERTRRFGADNRQLEQERWARSNPAQRARENHGRPEVAATRRPGDFHGNGVVRATRAGAPYKEPPREMRRGSEGGRPAPVERRPQNNAPRQTTPERRMERPAPRETQPNRQMERRAPPQPRNERQAQPERRMERPAPPQQRNERQMNRNERPPQVQRNQRESRPPQARPNENRGEQQRQARPQNEGRHEGNGHNPGPPHR